MRKITTVAALALAFLAASSLATATPIVQEQEQEQEPAPEQQYEGALAAVNLDAMEITIADSMGAETTIAISEETTVSGPDGPLTVADLQGREGSEVVVHCLKEGEALEALSVQLIA